MVVAKRQGRSEDQSEDFRQNKQHSWLSPIYIGQAQVEEKKHIKGGAKALFLSLSLSHSLSLPPCTVLHSLLFESLGWHALTLRGWILLLSSK